MSTQARAADRPTRTKDSPYVGLDYFVEEDADVFFGRAAERKMIISNLRASRLTLLYAESGVGKSSLLRAGVAARLGELARRDPAGRRSPRYLPIVFNTWRDDPASALIAEIEAGAKRFLDGEGDLELPRDTLHEAIQRAAVALDANPLLILDQFEEFFLYHQYDEAGERFASELADCVNRADVPANFLVSIREDAYSRIGDLFKARVPDVYANTLHLNYLDERAARAAIKQPIEYVNRRLLAGAGRIKIEDALVDEVLKQVRRGGGTAGAQGRPAANGARDAGDTKRFETAFLQLVMERLWVEETSTGSHTLRLETLNGLGGAETITRSHLDDAMAGLSVNQRDAAAAAFRFLVTPSGTKMALTAAELSEFSAIPESVLTGVLKHLEDERIMRPVTSPESHDGGPGGQASRYELLHDVLGDAALDWRKRHDAERQKKILLRQHEDAEERKLAEAAEQHQAQRNRIIRRAAIGLSCLVVLLIAAVAWAVYERNEAAQEREVARSRALAATADSQLQSDPERSILLARGALDIRKTPEAVAALRRALGASRLRLRIRAGEGLAQAVAAPDGRTVATVTNPGRVRFWRTSDGQKVDATVTVPWEVLDIAYSRDGRKVVVAGDGGAILHRLAPGARSRRLGPPRRMSAASFSADGRYVATGGTSGAVVWSASTDGASPAKPLTTPGPREPVIDIEFNPRDSGSLAAATFTDAYLLSRTGEDRRRLRRRGAAHANPGAIESLFGPIVSFSRDGRFLTTALRAFDPRVRDVSPERGPYARLWDAGTGRFVRELIGSEPPRGVNMMSWSPDNRQVAIATGKRVEVFDTASVRPRLALTGHGDWVWTAQFSPDGARLVTASRDGTARVWDARSGGELAELRGHSSDVSSAEFGPTGDWVLTAGRDGTARVWDTRTGRALGRHRDWVVAAAYSPDGRLAVTGAEDGSVRAWSLRGRGGSQAIDTGELDQVTDVEFDARSERILVTGRPTAEHAVRLVLIADAHSGEIINRLDPRVLITDATFSPGGRRVAIFPALDRPEIWDSVRQERVDKLKYPDAAGRVGPLKGRYSPDGRWIVTGGSDGVARVFDASTGRQEYSFRGHHGVVAGAAFSPDGQRAISFGFDGTARVWEPGGGELLALRGHDGWVTSAEFTPDGDRIVTGGVDRTVRVWDARTGEPLGILRPHAGIVNSVALSPDGRSILTASDDETAKITRCVTCLPVDDLVALADERVRRELTSVERREFVPED